MKIITVPADVMATVGDEISNKFTFKRVLTDHIDNYGETKTVSQLRQAQKIIDKLEAASDTLRLEDAEYEILKAACSKLVYRPVLARQFFKYLDAVEGAASA